MSNETVAFQREGHVGVINLINLGDNQAKKALLSGQFSNICADITSDEAVRVIILTSAYEHSFSKGTDLLKPSSLANEVFASRTSSIVESIAKLDQPVIASIKGDVTGQGLELVLACDIRIAVDTAHFGLPQIKTGLIPFNGGSQRLSRLVGRGKAMEMILTGESIDAKEAYRIGLINMIVRPDELMKVTMDMAQQMALRGPIALKYAKEAICKGMDLTLEQGLRLEGDLYFLLHTTSDRTEGIKAFREKKAPRFEGR